MSEQEGCGAVRGQFLALEQGWLSGAEAEGVRAHIASCEACGQAWEAWRADDGLLRDALGPVAVPRDVAGAVVAGLRAEAETRGTGRRRVLLWWLAAAAAVAVAVGGWLAYRGTRYERVGEVASARFPFSSRGRRHNVSFSARSKPSFLGEDA